MVTKQQIINSLSAWDADFSDNAVEVYVYRLRKRLEGTGAVIQTVRGFGYLLDVESVAERNGSQCPLPETLGQPCPISIFLQR